MIRVGPAGWSYPDWEGIVYPRHRGAAFHPLRHLAHFVDCVEINSTFYALPAEQHVVAWTRVLEGRPEFVFTAKLHRDFTHGPWPSDESHAQRLAQAFEAALAPLTSSGRLKALLAQFPVTFQHGGAELRRLGAIRRALHQQRLIAEVRHASWFTPPALSALRGLGYSVAHIDLPAAWNHPPTWFPSDGPIGYLRLHGRNASAWFDARAGRDQKYDYLYSEREIGELAQRTQRIAAEHDETFVVTNNHFTGKAMVNALELIAKLRGHATLAPAELVHAYPRLQACARHAGQQELF
ncbi:MAG: DUF72 domain-containing protein [Planctomycetes bacterium]|nr:DUF72 domain-containing protein [Planctomycetota bacterium]